MGLMEDVLTTHKDKVDLNSKDGLGNTALHNAAQAGHICKFFYFFFLFLFFSIYIYILYFFEINNMKDTDVNFFILLIIHIHGLAVPLEILIKHDALVNVQNNAGQTPLHLACGRSFKPGVEALLKAGADPNIMDLEKRKAHNFAHKKDIRDLLQSREKTTFTLAPITTSGKPAAATPAAAASAAPPSGGSIFLADMSMAVNMDDDGGDDDDEEPEEDDD